METETSVTDTIATLDINLHLFTPGIAAGLTVAILFLLCAAVISGAEMVIASFSTSDKSKIDKNKPSNKLIIIKYLSQPEKFFASLQIASLFFKTAFIVSTTFIAFALANNLMHSILGMFSFLFLQVCVLILLSEILPKTLATILPEIYLSVTFPIIRLIAFCFSLAGKTFASITVGFNKAFIINSSAISVNNITNAIELAKDNHSEDEEILKGIIKFGSIDVREILKPRIDVVAVDVSMSMNQVLAIVVESGYSRIPIYAGNFDNVKGILYVKDMLPFINEKDSFRWQTLMRPPYFIPDTKKVKELLTEFQTSKNHMAVIVDEYGGTIGIVTLEDILEEIVGEISDESDEDEKRYTQVNKNTYIFDGKTLLNDFHKILQIESDIFDDVKGDAETLAGLILELKGEIPAKNEQLKIQQFTFKIEAADSRRIKQIRVIIDDLEKQKQ